MNYYSEKIDGPLTTFTYEKDARGTDSVDHTIGLLVKI
jgi:hypothetical protein